MKHLIFSLLLLTAACSTAPTITDVQIPDLSHAQYADVHNIGPEPMRLLVGKDAVPGVGLVLAGQTARVRFNHDAYTAVLLKGN